MDIPLTESEWFGNLYPGEVPMEDRTQPNPDYIDAPPPLPPSPPNLAALAAGSFAEGIRIRLKLNYDVTDMSEDGQKLLLHWITQATKQFQEQIEHMHKIEVSSKLGKLERAKERGNNA
ncbi:MAG: hypothetical protein V4563_14570 [Pseudomonadota bacterium]